MKQCADTIIMTDATDGDATDGIGGTVLGTDMDRGTDTVLGIDGDLGTANLLDLCAGHSILYF